MNRLTAIARALAALFLAALPLSAQVTVVDAVDAVALGIDPNVHLQNAINAAPPGEILLVRSGYYLSIFGGGPSIDGKSLAIIGEKGASPPVIGRITLRNLGPTDSVVLRNLDTSLPSGLFSYQTGLVIESSEGTVWAEECFFPGSSLPGGALGNRLVHSGVLMEGPGVLHLVRCEVSGVVGEDDFSSGGPTGFSVGSEGGFGLELLGGTVNAWRSTITGGFGGDKEGSTTGSYAGGDAVHTSSAATLVLDGCTLTGGGADQESGGAGISAPAGTALQLFRRDSLIAGGPGSPDGPPVDAPDIVQTNLPAASRDFVLPAPLAVGEQSAVVLEGQPGDLVGVLLALAPGNVLLPSKQGALALGGNLRGPFVLGTIPASGQLTVPLQAPSLVPASLEGQITLGQLLVRPAGQTSKFLIGPPTAFTLVDG
ncbi:MAG: hypothetical protein DHS20C15_32320 [Planctomycetota bacterium]|nr:MAG: hypothetical protein DHS20C15_32320 [Planctomycetota bacterium]